MLEENKYYIQFIKNIEKDIVEEKDTENNILKVVEEIENAFFL